MSKVKICGLKRPEDIFAVNAARPDFCGFIVEFPKSARCVSKEQLRQLTAQLDSGIVPVGVFVNAPVPVVSGLLEEGTIEMAQLHGDEDEAYLRRLRSHTDKPLIQAFAIKTQEDGCRACESSADYILLDREGGGTGKAFDWSLLGDIRRPFFLAGGLGEDNLEEAITRISPWAVDLSSSLETGGRKDPEKIRRAVELVRKQSKK